MKTGLIYKVTGPDGKVYIGKSTISLGKRMDWHLREAFKINRQTLKYYYESKFYIALRQYGYNQFKWELLAENIPLEELEFENSFEGNCIKYMCNYMKNPYHVKESITDRFKHQA
jgi:hypothetical protein